MAASFGLSGGSVSIGVSLANNVIDNDVEAYMTGATFHAPGAVSVTATEGEYATSSSTAVSVAASVSIGVTLAGAGSDDYITLESTTKAFIDGASTDAPLSDGTSASSITIAAQDSSAGETHVVAVSVSIGLIALSASASVASTTVSPTVSAYSDGSQLYTSSGDIAISALSASHAYAYTDGQSYSTGISAAGTHSTATTSPTVNAHSTSSLHSAGGISLLAGANAYIAPVTGAIYYDIGDGIPTVTVMTVSGDPSGHVSTGSATFSTGSQSTAEASAGAIFAGSGAQADANDSSHATAYSTGSMQAGGAIDVIAVVSAAPSAETRDIAAGGIGVGTSLANATANGSATAYSTRDRQPGRKPLRRGASRAGPQRRRQRGRRGASSPAPAPLRPRRPVAARPPSPTSAARSP